jgi:hypothetical protein
MILLATSLERESSELGASPSFPALASSILLSGSATNEPLSRTIGDSLRLNVALDTNVRVTNMDGRSAETKARELARHPLDYFSEPGVYRLEFEGAEKFVAFNPASNESERALATEDTLKPFFSAGQKEKSLMVKANNWRETMERGGSAWRYFLGAAFLLALAELFVAMRRSRLTANNP